MTEELTLVGILAEKDFDQSATFSVKEIKKCFFDCLQIEPMYEPLLKVLEADGKVQLMSQGIGSRMSALTQDQLDEM